MVRSELDETSDRVKGDRRHQNSKAVNSLSGESLGSQRTRLRTYRAVALSPWVPPYALSRTLTADRRTATASSGGAPSAENSARRGASPDTRQGSGSALAQVRP